MDYIATFLVSNAPGAKCVHIIIDAPSRHRAKYVLQHVAPFAKKITVRFRATTADIANLSRLYVWLIEYQKNPTNGVEVLYLDRIWWVADCRGNTLFLERADEPNRYAVARNKLKCGTVGWYVSDSLTSGLNRIR